MVAATLGAVFAQPDQASAHETIERICRLFEKSYPQLVKVVQKAEVDVLACFSFPVEHRR
jgi:transposase-like protein